MDLQLHALNQFRVARFRALYKVGRQGLFLPPFKGGTFRGVFGSVLREVACTCPQDRNGYVSNHHDHCVYAYLFETQAKQEAAPARSENVPRPFLFIPPENDKTFYAPGETVWLGFSLFGKGIEYLPYFIFTLQKMGEKGFGRGNHVAQLLQVFSVDLDGQLVSIYENTDRIIKNQYHLYSGEDILRKASSARNRVSLYFISPTRLKYSGQYNKCPEFHVVLRSVARRITSLLYYHHDGVRIDLDFSVFFDQSKGVKLVESDMHWTEWERYSNRQKQRLKMGGVTGKAVYEGDLQPYQPWLTLSEYTNIGKNPTFGLGRTSVVFSDPEVSL